MFVCVSSAVRRPVKSGKWDYTLTMDAYADAAHTIAITSDTELLLNQKIHVMLSAPELDSAIVALVAESCWATSTEDSTSTPSHNLVIEG